MLYKILHFPASIAIYFYCRYIRITNKKISEIKGPVLIASNHPNSFLDAIILASLFKKPIYSLARGDAFTGGIINKILSSLKMLPVYRISEGAENLSHNFTTFSACNDIFKKNGIVLIFSEGRCVNEWHLRNLKKGTARLSLAAWNDKIPVQVIPLGINYNSFRSFGKNVYLNFGKTITENDLDRNSSDGKQMLDFNTLLYSELQKLVYEINPNDESKRMALLTRHVSKLKSTILFIPALIGRMVNYPIGLAIRSAIEKRANDHFDSIVVGLIFIFYPIYYLLIVFMCFIFFNPVIGIAAIVLLPFVAWSFVQLKKQ